MSPDASSPITTPTMPAPSRSSHYRRRGSNGANARWQWLTTTSTGLEILSDHVVIATGLNQVPHQPAYPGMEAFTGRLVHSKEYRNPDPFAGEEVLVVGMGNTGAEIALDLSENGVDTTISVRGPVNIVPRDVLGRPTQLTARMLARLPTGLADWLGSMRAG